MFLQNYLLTTLLTSYFLTGIMSCNLRFDSILSDSEMADGLVNERNFKDSSIRLRRDSVYDMKLIAISKKDEAEYGPRMIRRVIYPNDTKLQTMNDSQSSRLLNSEYYRQKEQYKIQQVLRKRFNGTVPVGCHLIEGPAPAADPAASSGGNPPAPAGNPPAPAGNPPAPAGNPPAPGGPPPAPAVRRRKREDPGNTTAAAPAAAPAPANTTAGSPAQPPTTVITTTTPKPVSLVCPPSTTIATTTPTPAPGAAPPAPAPAGAPPVPAPAGAPPVPAPAGAPPVPAPAGAPPAPDPSQNATVPGP